MGEQTPGGETYSCRYWTTPKWSHFCAKFNRNKARPAEKHFQFVNGVITTGRSTTSPPTDAQKLKKAANGDAK
jgi:hypothetical protein